MIKSLFIMSGQGEVIIERHWRGVTPRTVCDFFWDEVNKYETRAEVPPIMHTSKYYLTSILRDDIFLIATLQSDVPPLLVIEFLHRVVDIFVEYFGASDEASIKDNFSMVYQLLEEMLDNGNPLTTEPNALKAMIKPPTVLGRLQTIATGKSSAVSDVLPDGTISSMPWRKAGVKYAQNDIYLDIIEEVDAVVDRGGQVVSSEVTGAIMANSRLSGIPDLCLSFVDPEVIDDCSFHPCVRYSRFERDRVVSFVPPDGAFELMRYRVNTKAAVSAPIYVTPQVTMNDERNAGHGRISVQVGHKQHSSLVVPNKGAPLVIEDVALEIPFPKCVKTATLSCNVGTVLYDESTKIAKWNIGKLAPSAKVPTLTGSMVIQGQTEEPPAMMVTWKVPVASISGIQIAALQLTNEKYRPYKGVRTITKSGRFQVRA
ncbi:Mu homology domain-containing protein [Pelagophyceae sp. CCMP2097]|nr:Mu homology domain-containing protein [Pelagophyceae sp. CCMP2097]